MKKVFITISILIITNSVIFSFELSQARSKLYSAYILGDNSLWIEVMSDLEKSRKHKTFLHYMNLQKVNTVTWAF